MQTTNRPPQSRSDNRPLFRMVTSILVALCISFSSFYVGVITGIRAAPCDCQEQSWTPNLSDKALQRKVEELARQKVKSQFVELCEQISLGTTGDEPQATLSQKNAGSSLFSKSISHFAQGLARVSKIDLMETFDFGVPINANSEGLDALILYNTQAALPSNKEIARAARHEDSTKPLPLLSAKTATENCDTMNVVLINNPGSTKQCFALVGGQYQSYHVQRWMRRPDYGPLTPTMPLKLTSRGWTKDGRQDFVPPSANHVKEHQERLLTYLTEADNIKSRLRQTLGKMKQKTVIVLTCNLGQSELLMNFVCSARARGFDLQNVVVFPTDLETKELAEGVGLVTFYEEKLMASIPKEHSSVYGDNVFASIMFAKVLCVQLVNELGYDLLFQDVDVVWYKPPLDFFHDKLVPVFDMYFQDDGNRQERFAPYAANSGFYFVRSNAKTRHLFRQLLYSADLISAWHSHQAVLIALLAEHSSVMGLTVKIFPKEMEEFPGGLHFHRKSMKEMMKKVLSGDSKAYIFHMSWTENKTNKKKFFQQLGEWYLNDRCVGKEAHEISGAESEEKGKSKYGILSNHCCSAEPIITCHYRDKPSKIPCPNSPSIDNHGVSFW